MEQTGVSVVVVTYEDREAVLRCLASLARSTDRPLETIVVDNGSSDGTLDAIAAHFPDVRVIANGRNLLLAEARNIGLREARGNLVFFVDNDNVVDPRALHELVGVISQSTSIGMVGPVAHFLRAPERIWSAGSRLSLTTSLCAHLRDVDEDASLPIEVDCFPNAFMVRAQVARDVGLFDSATYGAEFHEADFGMRLKVAGYRVLLAPRARVFHDLPPDGAAAGWLRRLHFGGAGDSARIKAYFFGRNRLLFMRKYAGWRFWLFLGLFSVPLASFYSVLALLSGRLDLARAYLQGVRDGMGCVLGRPVTKCGYIDHSPL